MITIGERLTIDMQCLTTRVNQMQDEVNRIKCDIQDALDIWRNCACFGVGGEDEKQDEDGNPVVTPEVT